MSSKPSILFSGALGVIVAVAVIATAAFTGIPVPFTSRVINPNAPPGTFSILLTDPPHVPNGVTAVYITYNDVAVHISGLAVDSGWTKVNAQGTINTLGLVNVSMTISSAKIPAGQYNALKFNISSALVTFAGRNYSAFVRSGSLVIPIIGGVEVNASRPIATLIDIQPTVLNLGSQSNPEFVMSAVANATPVPSAEAQENVHQVGFRMPLQSRGWFSDFRKEHGLSFQVTSASLSANSLSVSVKSLSSSALRLRLVVISTSVPQHDRGMASPSMLFGAAVFVVNADGTLQPLQMGNAPFGAQEGVRVLFMNAGYVLVTGSSKTLSYSGSLTSASATPPQRGLTLTRGSSYIITVIGDETLSSLLVTAS